MKKRKLLITTVVLSFVAVILLNGFIMFNKKGNSIISSIFAGDYLAANNITSLSTPINLKWKIESTATAIWDSVENSNYYNVNVYIYDESDNLIDSRETGTSDNELDLQQEISYLINKNNIKKYKVSFDVTAVYMYDNTNILSDKSNESEKKEIQIGVGTIKLATPTNITIDESYNVTWTAVTGADHYWLNFNMNGSTYTLYGEPVFTHTASNYSYGTTTNGTFKANIKKAISSFYSDMVRTGKISSGQSVNLKFQVAANPSSSSSSDYLSSDYSSFSATFTYSDSTVKKLETPTNLYVDDDYNATWTAVTGADHYWLNFNMNGSIYTLYGEPVFTQKISNYSYGTTTNGTFKANIKKAISSFYNDMVRTGKISIGQSVNLKFQVAANPNSSSSNYISSDYSLFSSVFTYSDSTVKKLETPTNLYVDDDYNATWTAVTGADHYWLNFDMNGSTYTLYGEPVFTHTTSNYSYGTTTNGTFKANIKKAISSFYSDMLRTGKISSGKTVELKIKVVANPSSSGTSNYISGDYSLLSNSFYYNCDGNTKINDITLSPNKPVIAVGRTIYIGKTINPSSALYDSIKWTSSNNSVVSITNMGQITGLKKGTSTITAKINNATQTAEVNVYEIESNITDSTEANNVMNEANDIIEAVVADGDISNTDITDKNSVLTEIENGAENGDKFNVDVKYDDKNKNDYDSIKSNIDSKYSGFEIIGGKDIKIEISHTDSQGKDHHIANITELENEVSLKFDMNSKIPQLASTKTREYKVVRVHDNNIEEIDFDMNNGVIETSSDKFSDFILLYNDTDIPVNELTVDKNSVEINVGETSTINVQVLPSNAANKNYSSVSNDTDIATVSGNVITAVAPGNTTVTFTSKDGSYSKTVNVSVKLPLTSISLNKTTGTKNVGETETLTVTYNPTNTTDNKTVTWSTSDENIATVVNGVVTAKNPGNATITAKVGNKTATYKIDVKLPLTSISLNKTSGTLIAERNELLTVTYNPTNTTDDKTITWTSSDSTVATVTDGYVNALTSGTTTITAKIGDKTATYELTVIPRIKLTSISLNKTSETLKVGQEQTLTVTYNPTDTNDDKTVTWSTSDANIATVNNGKVKAIAPGTATITAKVGDKTVTYELTVKQPLTSISLNKTSGSLRVESTETLTVTYNPTNTTDNKTVTWTSSDSTVAKVENGKITALKVGTTIITAKVGDKTATYNLTVVEKETLQEVAVKKGYKVKNSFMHGFKLDDLINNIKSKLGLNVTTNTNSTIIATGVQFKYNDETFTAVVYGDLNGDGKINSADLLKMRQHLLGTSTLTGAYKEAGSIATGTTINSADLLRIRQHLLGQKSIEQ